MGLFKEDPMNRVKKLVTYSVCSITALFVMLICSKATGAYAIDVRTETGYRAYQNYKYIIEPTTSGDQVYDKDGNVLISAGRYCRIDYLGSDMFVVNKIQDRNYAHMHYREMFSPYIYNIKKGTEKKVDLPAEHPDVDILVHPFYNGYAKVENNAFYIYTPLTYYYFVDKNGKKLFEEVPYNFCSDMIKLSGELYYFTVGDHLTWSSGTDKTATRTITKRDINGNKVKSVTLSDDYSYDRWDLVKVGKTFYIKVYAISSKKDSCYMLYSTNLKKVKTYTSDEIKAMKSFTPLDITVGGDFIPTSIPKFDSYELSADKKSYIYYKERDWGFISPASTRATSIDVSSYSMEENAWMSLYTTAAEESFTNQFDTFYEIYGCYCNQAFIFEPVSTNDDGSVQMRIWSAHSGRQLRSYYDKQNNITRLVLGSYSDKDSKKKLIKEQIFTIENNSDGTFYIKNCDGKYLSFLWGDATAAGTWLVFSDTNKEKFQFTTFTYMYGRDSENKPIRSSRW